MSDPFIKIENLSFAYPDDDGGASEVLSGLNLEIERGSLTAVLGHNGSGKSTLAKLINLILTPNEGKITVDSLEITKPDLTEDELFENRRNVGMVFQNPDNQLVATIVEEDIAFGPENLGIPPKEIRRRVDDALETVGMTEFKRHSPSQLSGGQKQRVAIAGIIAMMPKCIIFDESTAMLDPSGRREVMDTILRLNREFGITVLHITHYMNEAAMCDRVVVINEGKIELDGTPKQVFSNVSRLQAMGLDVPQPTELLYELKSAGVNLPIDRLGPSECADLIYEKLPAKSAAASEISKAQPDNSGDFEAAVELKNITYVYSPNTPFCKTALDDVSLSIKKGVITGLMGHTGSGKSTLVQLFNGLSKPTEGQVFVGGKDIWADPEGIRKYRFKVGLVFQYPEYQLFEETVRRDIAFGPTNMELSEEEIARRVADSARFCGISEEMLEKSPFDLSGGQKRRVAIAGIMAMEPEVLVLDEPAAGLDPRGREEILGGIRDYQRERGNTVVIVSHSMEDMARYSDEIIVMNRAKLCMQGRTAEIFDRSEELTAVGLSVPQITELMNSLRARGVAVPHGIYTVDAAKSALMRIFGRG